MSLETKDSASEFEQLVLTPEEQEKYRIAKLRFKKSSACKHLFLTGSVFTTMLVLFIISNGFDSALSEIWFFKYTKIIYILMILLFAIISIPSLITLINLHRIKFDKSTNPEDVYIEDIIKPIIHKKYPKAVISTECKFNPKGFVNYGLLPHYDRCIQYLHIVDFDKNKNWRFIMENLKLVRTQYDEDTRTYVDAETLFNGQIYAIPFKSRIDGDVIILASHKWFGHEHTFKDNLANKYHKIDIEDIDFNENFEVYADNEADAFYVLNPSTVEALKALKKEYPQFGIHVKDNKFYISIDSGYPLFSIPSSGHKIDSLDLNEKYIMMQRLSYFCKQIRDGINARTTQ